MKLRLIGYWRGPVAPGWPDVREFVDAGWSAEEREGGVSTCRFRGRENGALELTDGTWYWPDGLVHYVADHDVRLPQEFVDHVHAQLDELDVVERDLEWWRRQ